MNRNKRTCSCFCTHITCVCSPGLGPRAAARIAAGVADRRPMCPNRHIGTGPPGPQHVARIAHMLCVGHRRWPTHLALLSKKRAQSKREKTRQHHILDMNTRSEIRLGTDRYPTHIPQCGGIPPHCGQPKPPPRKAL